MRKIIIEENVVEDIPYMLFYKADFKKIPLVIIAHGFNNNKYEGSDLAIRLAENGIGAITFDLYKQGQRYDGFLENVTCDAEFGYQIFNILKESYNDIKKLINLFKNDSRIDGNRLGLAGISLGAKLCYYSLANNKDIKVAVPILGSPKFKESLIYSMEKENESDFIDTEEKELLEFVKKMDPYEYLVQNESRELLIINASKDDDVPAKFAIDFYDEIQSKYKENNTAIELFVADEFHYVSNEMKDKTIDWFKKYL